MFEKEWMEYFREQDIFSYYCILFVQLIVTGLYHCSYLIIFLIALTPFIIIYSQVKSVKIQFVEDKKHKKLKKEQQKQQDAHQNLYIERLSKNLKKKRKH